MEYGDAQVARAQIAGGADKVPLFKRHCLGAGDAGDRGPREEAQDHDEGRHARLKQGIEDDHEQHAGQCKKDIGEPHKQHIELAADIAREDADRRADKDRDHHGRKADHKGNAAAVKGAGQIVAAEIIAAEGMLCRCGGELI